MDWEKKTVARPPLREAAADVFNDTKTPGQALLTALQVAETVRKDRYSSTVAAKMKAAREVLPALEARHPPRSDTTIFGKPGAEVSALLPNGADGVKRGTLSLEHVKAMMEGQMERHNRAWAGFVATRDDARSGLEAAVAAAVGSFQQQLETDDAGVAEDLAALDDDRVMRLTEQELYQVWDCVAQRIPQRARWIEECAAALEAAEERRRERVEAALVSLCAALNDAAVVSEGEVERLVEKEAMALNVAILENRRAYADLVSRLQVAEVEAERSRRATWQDGLRRWRTLRTQHAIRTFVERIRSPEFAEPAERLAEFAALRERQTAALAALTAHWGRAGAITPPHLSARKLNAWNGEAAGLAEAWAKERQQLLSAMRSAEDVLEARVGELLGALREEVTGYRGYPPEELAELVSSQAGVAVAERRQAALELLQQADVFLEEQASAWSDVSAALSGWLAKLCAMHDAHRSQTATDESEVRGALKQSREAFNAADAAREAALDAAVAAVTRGSGEAQLDACVAEALKRLDDIEAGYRSFHRDMTTLARAYPGAVRTANDSYHVQLCSALGVQAQTRLSATSMHRRTEGGGAVSTSGAAEQGGAAKAAEAATGAAVTEATEPPELLGHIKLPDGRSFAVIADVLDNLLNPKPPPEPTPTEPEPEPGPPPPEPPPPPPPPPPPESRPRTPKKTPPQGSKAAAAASAAAAAAEAAAAAAAAAAVAAAAPPPQETTPPPPPPPPRATSPLSLAGTPLCRSLSLPNDTLRKSIESIQAGLLSDMMTFCQRTLEAADSWAAEREVALTQELDGWLRHHRPRAGRIEEEVRTARSVELVAQRRRVELHLKMQSKAVKAQAAAFEEGLRTLEADVSKSIARLRATEDFLGQCLSSKSIGIRQREAEALKARLEKDLTSKVAELSERNRAAIAKITEANRKFESDELRTFDSGGTYADDNAAAYRRSLAAIDAHLARVGEEQAEKLEAARGVLEGEADAALSHVVSLVPSHEEDMGLVERVDALVEGARKRAAGELERNKAAAASIAAQLDRLDQLLDGRKTPAPAPVGSRPTTSPSPSRSRPASSAAPRHSPSGSATAPATAASNGLPSQPTRTTISKSATANTDIPAAPLDRCRAILECVDGLRQALLRQAKVLDFLASASLTTPPVDLRLDAAGIDPRPPPLGSDTADIKGAPTSAGLRRGEQKTSTGTPNRGTAAAAAATAAAAQNAVSKLATDVEGVIDACKKETESVAKAYYAAKDKARPIRYPARIPPTVEELLNRTDAVLEGLREQTLSYVREAVKELRTQVIRAYRALERLPAVALALLAEHEVAAVEVSHRAMVSEMADRRGALLKLVEVHRASLHPAMIMPARRPELASIKTSEADRAAAHTSLLASYGTAAVELARREAPALQSRLVRLAAQLAMLLDSFLLPQDLPPPGDDDAWVYDLTHKDYKQLLRLALAQQEAETVPPPPPPPDPKAGKPGARGGTPGTPPPPKQPPAKGGKVEAPPPPNDRPYAPGTWTLPAGNFDLVSLGWLDEEGKPPRGLQPPPPIQVDVPQSPLTPPPVAQTPAKGGKAGAKAAPTPPPKVEVPPGRQPLAPEPPPLSALDTPCHRCVVRAYRAAVQRVEEALRSKMSDHRQRTSSWVKDEELWENTWTQLVARLEGL